MRRAMIPSVSLLVFFLTGLTSIAEGDSSAAGIAETADSPEAAAKSEARPTTRDAPTTRPDVPKTPDRAAYLSRIDLGAAREVGGELRTPRRGGGEIAYTVEPDLQSFIDGLFEQYRIPAAAAVLLNSRTGRVLAFSQQRLTEDAADTEDVALDASPPAASVFKIVTTAALLEQSPTKIDTETCYRGGSSRLTLENLKDWPRSKSACASLRSALGRSINSIFAKLADRKLPEGALARYAEKFGFNRYLPFDVPVPRSEAEEPPERLERARTAAGFWHTHLSPLHGAMIAQSLGQGGAMLRPYIIDRVTDREGNVIHQSEPQYLSHTVDKKTALQIVEAMTETVARGTARRSFRDSRGVSFVPKGVRVAAKTGTLTGSQPYRAYTWFVGLAPADDPQVSIAVLVVNDPKWRIKAAAASARILQRYFALHPPAKQK